LLPNGVAGKAGDDVDFLALSLNESEDQSVKRMAYYPSIPAGIAKSNCSLFCHQMLCG